MAFVPVLSFVLLLLFGSANTWAACVSGNFIKGYSGAGACVSGSCGSGCSKEHSMSVICSASLTSPDPLYTDCKAYSVRISSDETIYCTGGYIGGCRSYTPQITSITCHSKCATKCEADSLVCSRDLSKVWDSANCQCKDNVLDTTYHCQNVGDVNVLNGGYPSKALIFTCVDDVCNNTSTLAGTCQDWGFCPDGVDDCEIPKDSTGHRPCARSGVGTTSTTICYYQCVDGRQLRCKPTSTQYVAGSIYVGTCPERPPTSCDPPPNYSSSSGASSSGSSGSSGDNGGGYWSSGSGGGSGGSSGSSADYMPILIAIHDTLHNANKQRKVLEDYAADISPAIKSIEQNTFDASRIENQINNRLSTLQENGVEAGKNTKKSIDSTVTILDEINRYLRHDSLVVYSHDTSYNPLLRDIKAAIDSQTDSIVLGRDTSGNIKDWFDKYYSDSVQSNSYVGKKLAEITANLPDSAKRSVCARFNECLAGPDPKSCVLIPESQACLSGGTPFDTGWNLEWNIVKSLWDFFFDSSKDTTPLPSVPPLDTTPLPRTPAEDSARKSIKDANDSIDLPSIRRSLDSMRARLDSIKTKKDSVKIDVDSTMLDSAEAARYVQHILLPSGTGTTCFVCNADLGTFGGLAPDGLAINIDFSNFGGYNWCDLGRAIIKIMTLVVCISLTLGSWAAAFGYSPKNDA